MLAQSNLFTFLHNIHFHLKRNGMHGQSHTKYLKVRLTGRVILHKLNTKSHCACIPVLPYPEQSVLFLHIRIYLIFFLYKPRKCKAKSLTVQVAFRKSLSYIIAKPGVNQSFCLQKLIRFSMM